MGGMAQPLSDRDMIDIAAYLASLPGPLVSHR
jgi:cytochrome c553